MSENSCQAQVVRPPWLPTGLLQLSQSVNRDFARISVLSERAVVLFQHICGLAKALSNSAVALQSHVSGEFDGTLGSEFRLLVAREGVVFKDLDFAGEDVTEPQTVTRVDEFRAGFCIVFSGAVSDASCSIFLSSLI